MKIRFIYSYMSRQNKKYYSWNIHQMDRFQPRFTVFEMVWIFASLVKRLSWNFTFYIFMKCLESKWKISKNFQTTFKQDGHFQWINSYSAMTPPGPVALDLSGRLHQLLIYSKWLKIIFEQVSLYWRCWMPACKLTKATLSHTLFHVFCLHSFIEHRDYFFWRGSEIARTLFLLGNINNE